MNKASNRGVYGKDLRIGIGTNPLKIVSLMQQQVI